MEKTTTLLIEKSLVIWEKKLTGEQSTHVQNKRYQCCHGLELNLLLLSLFGRKVRNHVVQYL